MSLAFTNKVALPQGNTLTGNMPQRPSADLALRHKVLYHCMKLWTICTGTQLQQSIESLLSANNIRNGVEGHLSP